MTHQALKDSGDRYGPYKDILLYWGIDFQDTDIEINDPLKGQFK